MSVLADPEGQETATLFSLFDDFAGRSVLEVGCGSGRLTWRYAVRAARVVAIDADPAAIARAVASKPAALSHVQFLAEPLEDFAGRATEKFDLAVLAWSL